MYFRNILISSSIFVYLRIKFWKTFDPALLQSESDHLVTEVWIGPDHGVAEVNQVQGILGLGRCAGLGSNKDLRPRDNKTRTA